MKLTVDLFNASERAAALQIINLWSDEVAPEALDMEPESYELPPEEEATYLPEDEPAAESQPEPAAEPPPAEMPKAEVPGKKEEAKPDTPDVTLEACAILTRQLVREKIMSREAVVNKLKEDYGAESARDLTQDELNKFYAELKETIGASDAN